MLCLGALAIAGAHICVTSKLGLEVFAAMASAIG
jgi:hypothetical protein